MRISLLVLALLVPLPAQASGEWQIKPFLGATFGGSTSYVDPELAAGDPKVTLGVSVVFLGEVFGVEGDFGHTPGFFESGRSVVLIAQSGVTTVTGNIVIALPRHLTQYTLRPYIAGGTGLMRATIQEDPRVMGLQHGTDNIWAIDMGGGATGFLTNRIGISWDLRWFRSIGGAASGPLVFLNNSNGKQLSFWRASMAVAIRP